MNTKDNPVFNIKDELPNGTTDHHLVVDLKSNAGGVIDEKALKALNDELVTVDEILPVVKKVENERRKEKWYSKMIQIVIPFFIAGFGMVGAGILFAYVVDWEVFVKVKEIIVLVPALLGLKGNLDMTLASRLSTQVNLGEVHNKKTIIQVITGNVFLKLLQSIVVGLLASFVACLTEYIQEGKFTPEHLLIIIASSVTSAAITSIVLGLLVMAVILISHKVKINPDNVATPIAGSVGDVGTLITLAGIASFFYTYRDMYWIHIIFIAVLILICPIMVVLSKKNPFVKSTLYQGWLPIITAMLISSVSGIVLNIAVQVYNIESYQPVINGVGGNLVSIYASRLSTEIAREPESRGKWVSWAPSRFIKYPFHTFFAKQNPESKTARLLMFLVLPGHVTFFFIIYFLSEANIRPKLTAWLVLFYLAAAVIQVLLLFLICYLIVHLVWRLRKNPDDYCISLLTALGDLFGVSLLYLCFHLIYLTGDTSVRTENSTGTIDIASIFNETTTTSLLFF